jgi:isoaspartyl peptidase/L-asparaginase-like protein (Ntn-hydrolase superfamily)
MKRELLMAEDDKPSWALIAHGGAKDIEQQDEAANRQGLYEAIVIGSNILSAGGTAIDAVEAVVKKLENDPAYNAGLYGSVTNEEGNRELTASIMDGLTLDIGAVAGLQSIEHPVSVARALLKDKAIFLIGDGAKKFAYEKGFHKANASPNAAGKNTGCDTVGCVALDQNGNLAVATSTGGLEGTRPGRVGDVPLPGCGFYADNERGGVSASGEGESIARIMLASEFLHFLPDRTPDEAIEKALYLLNRVDGEAGLIAITPDGEIGWGHNSSHFAVGKARADQEPHVFLKKSEDNEKR